MTGARGGDRPALASLFRRRPARRDAGVARPAAVAAGRETVAGVFAGCRIAPAPAGPLRDGDAPVWPVDPRMQRPATAGDAPAAAWNAMASTPRGRWIELLTVDVAEPVVATADGPLRCVRHDREDWPSGSVVDRRVFELPDALFDGQEHRLRVAAATPLAGVRLEQGWTCDEAYALTREQQRFVQHHPLPAPFPAEEVERIRDVARNGPPPVPPAAIRATLAPPAGAAAPSLVAYVLAPTLAAALATPAIGQLRGWFGDDVAFEIVLPSATAVGFGIATDRAERLAQIVPVHPESALRDRIADRARRASILVPWATTLADDARAAIADVAAGRRDDVLGRVATAFPTGHGVLRCEERASRSPPPAARTIAVLADDPAAATATLGTRDAVAGPWLAGDMLVVVRIGEIGDDLPPVLAGVQGRLRLAGCQLLFACPPATKKKLGGYGDADFRVLISDAPLPDETLVAFSPADGRPLVVVDWDALRAMLDRAGADATAQLLGLGLRGIDRHGRCAIALDDAAPPVVFTAVRTDRAPRD